MTVVAWTFALLAAAVHILAFAWETLLFRRPGVHHGVFAIPTADVPPVMLWAFNVGFYNLFLACGAVAGVIAWAAGEEAVGRALVTYTATFMFLAGIALFASDRMALSRPRGTGVGGALAQSSPALGALVATVLS
jgi:putative membrane protein